MFINIIYKIYGVYMGSGRGGGADQKKKKTKKKKKNKKKNKCLFIKKVNRHGQRNCTIHPPFLYHFIKLTFPFGVGTKGIYQVIHRYQSIHCHINIQSRSTTIRMCLASLSQVKQKIMCRKMAFSY